MRSKGREELLSGCLLFRPAALRFPPVALFEVERGALSSNNASLRRKQLAELVSVCQVLPFDDRAALLVARLQLELERKRKMIGPLDTLIAATALANAAILITHNTREFSRVAGLQLEDWF